MHCPPLPRDNEIDFDSFMALQPHDFTDLQVTVGARAKLSKLQQSMQQCEWSVDTIERKYWLKYIGRSPRVEASTPLY